MPRLEQTLQRLGLSFTVRDIMVPKECLVCASAEADAPRISQQYPDYNIIPIQDNGVIVGFYERETKSSPLRSITVQDLVGGDTSIMDLVDILSRREFCFALVGNEIGGYVHFSDLNNPLVKLTFYVIFEAFERHLLTLTSPVSDGEIEQTLGVSRLNRIKERVRKAQDNRANLSLENFLFLPEILSLAVYKRRLTLDKEERERINRFRNRVSHAGWSLIQNHRDVMALLEAKTNCITVLNDASPGVFT